MRAVSLFLLGAAVTGCGPSAPTPGPAAIVEGACTISAAEAAPDFLDAIPCRADVEALASVPLDSSIPGARSGKVVLDQLGGDVLYFQTASASRSTMTSPRRTSPGESSRWCRG